MLDVVWETGVSADLKRRIIENLRPSLLDHLGLAAAVQWYVDEKCGEAKLHSRVTISRLERLPADLDSGLIDGRLTGHIRITSGPKAVPGQKERQQSCANDLPSSRHSMTDLVEQAIFSIFHARRWLRSVALPPYASVQAPYMRSVVTCGSIASLADTRPRDARAVRPLTDH